MSRPLRLEHEGDFWHITARGNDRKDIFRDDLDRQTLLELLGHPVVRYKWRLRDYVEMSNNHHRCATAHGTC